MIDVERIDQHVNNLAVLIVDWLQRGAVPFNLAIDHDRGFRHNTDIFEESLPGRFQLFGCGGFTEKLVDRFTDQFLRRSAQTPRGNVIHVQEPPVLIHRGNDIVQALNQSAVFFFTALQHVFHPAAVDRCGKLISNNSDTLDFFFGKAFRPAQAKQTDQVFMDF